MILTTSIILILRTTTLDSSRLTLRENHHLENTCYCDFIKTIVKTIGIGHAQCRFWVRQSCVTID